MQPFIEHSVKSEPWMRNGRLVGGLILWNTGFFKVRFINTARKQIHIGMTTLFCLVERCAANEDDVSFFKQFLFKLSELSRRKFESRQFVHTIINNQLWNEAFSVSKSHWCIIP